MTEYDYSPEGYERYMATQHRIANWVDHTEHYRPQFEPAAPGAPPGSVTQRPMYQSHDSHHRSHSGRQEQRPPPMDFGYNHYGHPPSPGGSSVSESYAYGPGSPGPMPYPGAVYPQQPMSHHSHQSPTYIMASPPPMPPYPSPYGYPAPAMGQPIMAGAPPGYVVLPPPGRHGRKMSVMSTSPQLSASALPTGSITMSPPMSQYGMSQYGGSPPTTPYSHPGTQAPLMAFQGMYAPTTAPTSNATTFMYAPQLPTGTYVQPQVMQQKVYDLGRLNKHRRSSRWSD
ncbi:hypothetical protein BDQ12DRAFT_664064 [Crucibulum laeve]|uniref:Uncharacterized protein n=1 Tax=Crucibulum laeve TaxID=68775 RepID=A0A5C3M7E4_9AGAR|nr:hypothetical protein BDQ12DRAFT_664064 [Crucibulum laeve]